MPLRSCYGECHGAAAVTRAKALPRSADGHRMNKTEAAYSRLLDMEIRSMSRHERAVCWQAFEPVSLRLGTGASYKPDFMVQLENGEVEFHEVKGFWREAARVRIKIAAHQFPMFRFIAVKRAKGGGWDEEEIKP